MQLSQEPGTFTEAHEAICCTSAAGAPTSRDTRTAAASTAAITYMTPHEGARLMRVRPVARRTRSEATLAIGALEAHKEAMQGTKMIDNCAVALDLCPTCHP